MGIEVIHISKKSGGSANMKWGNINFKDTNNNTINITIKLVSSLNF